MTRLIIAVLMMVASVSSAAGPFPAGNASSRSWDWMDLGAIPYNPAMVTTWNLTVDDAAGKTITLPLKSGAAYDFTVDWGDGTSGVVTSFDDADRIHEYASTGTKTVSMTGTLEAWYFNNGGDKLKFKTVASWGEVRFTAGGLVSAFYGCANATTFAAFPYMPVTSLVNTWIECSSMTSIDVSALTLVTSLNYTWYKCSGLTTVPVLPSSSTALANVSYAFRNVGTGMSGTVVALWNPTNFPNITSFANTFTGATGLTNYADIPNSWKGL